MDSSRAIIVHLGRSSGDGRRRTTELLPGTSTVFGYDAASSNRIDVREENISEPAGRITASQGHWLLSNFSPAASYIVENIEGRSEFVKVLPGREHAPIPFELSRVILPDQPRLTRFSVLAPAPRRVSDSALRPSLASRTFSLPEDTKYFLVLVALCEPRLRASSLHGVPTDNEIVERLQALPSCRNITRAAVNYHLDYLASTKLPLDKWGDHPGEDRMRWKREALVSIALRHDLVRDRHLDLLPPSPDRARLHVLPVQADATRRLSPAALAPGPAVSMHP
ncbi:serine/threonine protein kinase [Streptomyces sp. NPDC002888]|uniref:serine/threonine protein kinase n=1 Tax=Streptomyces sp. NPDC002888 TaxID=3364668 RepID=UPI0036CAA7E7